MNNIVNNNSLNKTGEPRKRNKTSDVNTHVINITLKAQSQTFRQNSKGRHLWPYKTPNIQEL